MFLDICKAGINMTVHSDFRPHVRPSYILRTKRFSEQLGASVNARLDLEACVDDANVTLGRIGPLCLAVERSRQCEVVFGQYAARYTADEHTSHKRI